MIDPKLATTHLAYVDGTWRIWNSFRDTLRGTIGYVAIPNNDKPHK